MKHSSLRRRTGRGKVTSANASGNRLHWNVETRNPKSEFKQVVRYVFRFGASGALALVIGVCCFTLVEA